MSAAPTSEAGMPVSTFPPVEVTARKLSQASATYRATAAGAYLHFKNRCTDPVTQIACGMEKSERITRAALLQACKTLGVPTDDLAGACAHLADAYRFYDESRRSERERLRTGVVRTSPDVAPKPAPVPVPVPSPAPIPPRPPSPPKGATRFSGNLGPYEKEIEKARKYIAEIERLDHAQIIGHILQGSTGLTDLAAVCKKPFHKMEASLAGLVAAAGVTNTTDIHPVDRNKFRIMLLAEAGRRSGIYSERGELLKEICPELLSLAARSKLSAAQREEHDRRRRTALLKRAIEDYPDHIDKMAEVVNQIGARKQLAVLGCLSIGLLTDMEIQKKLGSDFGVASIYFQLRQNFTFPPPKVMTKNENAYVQHGILGEAARRSGRFREDGSVIW